MSFADLKLIPELQRAVADEGYTEPTPIQAKAIPAVLERRDIMGCAQTGTGKTAGFTLPLLQLLAPYANSSPSPARHPVRALILTPTRELAAQVSDSVRGYGKYLKLRSTVVYGGIDMTPQTKALREGVDILVATPGRLLDHVQQKSVALGQVEILVLDEADRMLDMGFIPDIKRIINMLPGSRQTLLFSATFSDEIRKLSPITNTEGVLGALYDPLDGHLDPSGTTHAYARAARNAGAGTVNGPSVTASVTVRLAVVVAVNAPAGRPVREISAPFKYTATPSSMIWRNRRTRPLVSPLKTKLVRKR